jgi:hypothetical protein
MADFVGAAAVGEDAADGAEEEAALLSPPLDPPHAAARVTRAAAAPRVSAMHNPSSFGPAGLPIRSGVRVEQLRL